MTNSPLPIATKFELGDCITQAQRSFLDHYGFLHFKGVATRQEVAMIIEEMDRVESQWISENRQQIYGIPLFFGKNLEAKPMVQRFAFTSLFSEKIHAFIHDLRFEPIRTLIGEDARVGDKEKDGVVINRNINIPGSAYPQLGWHTDGLRDLFYGKLPQQMLNVGMHLDDCPKENGGLRLIPCSHTQGLKDMLLRKAHFISHRPDPDEICVETQAGDLTVHDGRLWHRVAKSPRTGKASIRRTMYVPYLTGPYQPKGQDSPMPAYHRLGCAIRRIKAKIKERVSQRFVNSPSH